MTPLGTALASAFAPLLLASEDNPLSHVLPHELGKVGGYSLTNTLAMLLVAALVMLVTFPFVARRDARVPTGSRNFFEAILQFLREQVARPALHEATDRYMPFLWTVFFLILIANLLGALPIAPILTLVTGKPSHFGGTATGDISITAALAICAFFAIHVGGIREQGFVHYAKNFAPHVPWPLLILLVPLEILAAFVKPFALAIRLFANMIAGHIVLAILLGFSTLLADGLSGASVGVTFASVVGATAISLLEIFVAFLQAYIFMFLTTLFIGMAVHPEH
jgi:F-type H+-transporting ATPase subunit a